ncbi:BZ3500_MvSof-1268-A1-R1_Chr1-3g01921 [Microbotryum saponariae]|uniref:BZ3500_MvSof-1268-A1-R1_Chr1-3g01921 protein n=1 Tax=Microbotryum saponariae TaxID=289078 RepID=A0A2X0KVL8_9BASI|nr:BZ3500_MvSof-1268-A1-R1_Chr1-3g01921 [Microbotryum saponariae]SCZ94905.1 BZ3501_MvSof-1269-A2-R1_Chr1-3g01523 [Microbotryum saponariae]
MAVPPPALDDLPRPFTLCLYRPAARWLFFSLALSSEGAPVIKRKTSFREALGMSL